MKKQQIILIAIIAVVIGIITAIVANIINNNKSEEVDAKNIENNTSVKNEILYVGLENEINELNSIVEKNVIEENTIQENIIVNVGTTNNSANNTNKSSNTGTTKYKLEVNCEQNVVNVYTKDENGEYTNCVKVMLCSVGSDTPTSGTYSLKKYDGWEWKGLFGDVYGQYATQITGNILFHSVPYTEKYNHASLEYWEYDKLGTPASMGCVRLTVQNAKWIYNNCAAGTKVKFYKDSNPGPLGKPSERKISSETEYRNWDPTDPSSENPWRNYTVKEENSNTGNTSTITNSGNTNSENANITTNTEKTNIAVNSEKINTENSEVKNNQTVNDVSNEDKKVNDTIQSNNDKVTDTSSNKTNSENKENSESVNADTKKDKSTNSEIKKDNVEAINNE